MHDPNIGLIDIAESGFHTGVFKPIQFSGIWRRQQSDARDDLHFEIYDTNWKSAEEDRDTVTRLLQEDIDAKFVQEFHADIAQAKKRWPKGFAIGRLSVSRTENKDPRLCLDSTIANVNAKAQIQEKSFNPCVEDSRRKPTPSKPHQGRMAMLPMWPCPQPQQALARYNPPLARKMRLGAHAMYFTTGTGAAVTAGAGWVYSNTRAGCEHCRSW